MITFNNIVERFQVFADNHFFIKSFSFGSPDDVDLSKFTDFPLMHLVYTGATYDAGTKTYNLEVYILDIPNEKKGKVTPQKESISDSEQCAEDIISDIRNGGNIFLFAQDYEVVNATTTPLEEETKNVLSGILLDISVAIPYEWDACNAPIDGVAPGGSEVTYARRGVLRMLTLDGATDVTSVRTINVTNGTLTDDGDGVVTLDTGGGVEALEDLSDVNIIGTPDQGDVISYNTGTSQWIRNGGLQLLLARFKASGTGAQVYDTLNDTSKGFVDVQATSAKIGLAETALTVQQTSPGTLTFSVAAGGSGVETQFDSVLLSGQTVAGTAHFLLRNGTDLRLENSSSYQSWIRPNASASSDITIGLPATTGTLALTSDIPTGHVEDVTGTSPIVSSGGDTPDISITAATTSAAGSMSSADKTKLDGIATGAEVNVNADWNAVSGDAEILNKPTLSAGTVTSITAGTGLDGGTITASGTIDLANTAVTAGAYTSADITVDAQGRVTAAASGSGGSSLWTASGSDIYYNTGNVGIGTSSPVSVLHAQGLSSAASVLTLGGNVSSGGSNAINFKHHTCSTNVAASITTAGGAYGKTPGMVFSIRDLNSDCAAPISTDKIMTIETTRVVMHKGIAVEGGDIEIGLEGNQKRIGVRTDEPSQDYSTFNIDAGQATYQNRAGGHLHLKAGGGSGSGDSGDVTIWTVQGALPSGQENQVVERLSVKPDGKVGIGTTSPSELLTVSGNISNTGSITTTGAISGNGSSVKVGKLDSQVGAAASAGEYGLNAETYTAYSDTVVAGSFYALDATAWVSTNATTLATASKGMIGMATSTGSGTGMVIRGICYVLNDPGGAIGDVVYLSTASGRLSTTPVSATGNVNRVVGYKIGTNLVFFNPSQDWIEIS